MAMSATIAERPAVDAASLDPYALMAVLGKRVIHPGGRRATDELVRTLSRWSYLKRMAWLVPRIGRAVPYLGYLVVAGTRPG